MTDVDSEKSDAPTAEPEESKVEATAAAKAAAPGNGSTEAVTESSSESSPSESSDAADAAEPSSDVSGEAATEATASDASGDAEVTASDAPSEAAGEKPASDAPSEAPAEATADGAAKKKKKRRRRRKKASTEGAPTPEAQAKVPFLNLVRGGQRRHAFSVGEIIAGRVVNSDEGAIVVDLFGKATAVSDVDEPREIPVVVPAAEETPNVEAASAESETAAATAPPVDANDDKPAPKEPVSQTDVDDWAFAETQPADAVSELESDLEAAAAFIAAAAIEAAAANEADTTEEAAAAEATGTDEAPQPSEAASLGESASPDATKASDAGVASGTAEPVDELADADLSLLEPLPPVEAPTAGAIFRGRIGAISESGHIAIVNRDIDKAEVRKAIRAARAKKQRVQGVVFGFNRGGFDVLVGGIRTFCPASGMSLTSIEDPNAFIGRRLEFSLPEQKSGKRSIIVSRRNILEKESRKRARERMAELEIGQKLPGKVTEVRDYGVLVDLGGGLDGLVHMTEVSWNRGHRPADVAKVGDDVEVQVIKLQQASRKDRYGRVSLSLRACAPDPWDAAADVLKRGHAVKGKVVRTAEFGAFIQLADDIEGLLHISELGGKDLTHAKQAVKEGDEINVVVERVDREQRRISLSKLSPADAAAIEAGEFDPSKAPKSLKSGSHISVIVKRIDHRGAQVQVEGVLGKRGRGFISNRDLGERGGDQRKGPTQGDRLDVKIVGTERDGTLRCSVRGRQLDEERRAVRDYRKEASKQGLGTFGDLLRAKLGDSSDQAN